MLLSIALLSSTASLTAPSKDYICPGSPSFVHAYVQVEGLAYASCKAVRSEILGRVASQGKGWHDPHNNGNYSVLDSSESDVLELQRTTGWPGLFTDKLTFVLEPSIGACIIRGCSESQVFSVSDMSTNYCNLRMLYCGTEDGCKPVQTDFKSVERSVMHSIGAGTDKATCLAVAA